MFERIKAKSIKSEDFPHIKPQLTMELKKSDL